MARQVLKPNSWQKDFEIYQNFRMGLNTSASNESLSEQELPYAQNAVIGQRGTVERRTGMKLLQDNANVGTGQAQGNFRYYYAGGTYTDIIAKNGVLYIGGVAKTITGVTGSLQTTREMNAVQYKDVMYIATGTKLVTYDGTTFAALTSYQPDGLEAMYVGLNGLEASPEDFLKDRVSVVPSIDALITEEYRDNEWRFIRYAKVNQTMRVRAVVAKPVGDTLEFKYEKRNATDKPNTYPIVRDWSTQQTWSFIPNKEGLIEVKVSIRKVGTTLILAEYSIPKYLIKSTKNPADEGLYSPTLHQCNRIFIYWERLYVYGDPSEPDVLYASDIQNFNYFPLSNTLRFENDRKEGITTVDRFRDTLIIFTNSTIQVLEGKIPSDWARTMVNSGIGCIAPNSVQSVDNALIFLSKDGVYRLKSTTFTENNMNVERLDYAVQNLTEIDDTQACSVIYNSEYQIVYPSLKRRVRFSYVKGIWALDTSNHLDLRQIYTIDGVLYGQKLNGSMIEFDPTSYKDIDDVYEFIAELKGMSFGMPYHVKKMKQLHITIGDQPVATAAQIEGFVDDTKVLDNRIPILATTKMTTDPTELLTELYKMNMQGKGHYVKTRIKHSEDKPFAFVGMGFVFKTKKP